MKISSVTSPKEVQYLGLRLIDILAYYVPGWVILMSFIIIADLFEAPIYEILPGINGFIPDEPYIRGLFYTALVLLVPFLLGHLAYPLTYLCSQWCCRDLPKQSVPYRQKVGCVRKGNGAKCDMGSVLLSRCLLKASHKSPGLFFDYWILRFRALSRFCRALFFPIGFLGLCLVVHAYSGDRSKWFGPELLLGVALITSVIGLGTRVHRNEKIWRHAVCAASTSRHGQGGPEDRHDRKKQNREL